MTAERRARICVLNDQLRQRHIGGRILLSRGLLSMGKPAVKEALKAIAEIHQFDSSSDPYGEHDFGSVVGEDRRRFWKIDYYERTLGAGAVDPADANTCTRVLTVMLAEEF